jgi:CRP/FNR family transcriptional regulator, cyclic AMP receptor protein
VTLPSSAPLSIRDPLLRGIAERANVKRYPAHTVLITEGDAADTLYIVLSGRAKVYASNESGKDVILTVLEAGDLAGEIAIDGGTRSASVMTLEPTSCALVSGAELRAFIVDHPDFAHQLILKLIARVRSLTGRVKSLALEDVYCRVVALLQATSAPDGERSRIVTQKMTQQDIAEHVGSSREMVSRIFKQLTVGGYVALEGGHIRLLKTPPASW